MTTTASFLRAFLVTRFGDRDFMATTTRHFDFVPPPKESFGQKRAGTALSVMVILFFNCLFSVCIVSSQTLHGFVLSGNPASLNGATWTYRDTVQSIIYDLSGILFKPSASATYPAVVISHGRGGNVTAYSASIAKEMRSWVYDLVEGLVCIATNYTHAEGVPIGSLLVNEQLSPGSYATEWNARGFTSSVYYYQLRAGDFVQTKKLLLIR